MKSSFKKGQRKNRTGMLFLFSLLCALVSNSALSRAANPAVSNAQPVTGISVTNNSAREIRHLYLSPVDLNNWGPDLLNGTIVRKRSQLVKVSQPQSAGVSFVMVQDVVAWAHDTTPYRKHPC